MSDPAYEQALEELAIEAYGEGSVTEVIRPAAIIPEREAREILFALSALDVRNGGLWYAEPQRWQRFDRSWEGSDAGAAELLGTLQVIYGSPTRFEVTVYRATVTALGAAAGWTVQTLCDEALTFGGLSLATCPRAALAAPPKPFLLH